MVLTKAIMQISDSWKEDEHGSATVGKEKMGYFIILLRIVQFPSNSILYTLYRSLHD